VRSNRTLQEITERLARYPLGCLLSLRQRIQLRRTIARLRRAFSGFGLHDPILARRAAAVAPHSPVLGGPMLSVRQLSRQIAALNADQFGAFEDWFRAGSRDAHSDEDDQIVFAVEDVLSRYHHDSIWSPDSHCSHTPPSA